jgi:hypothetical protein
MVLAMETALPKSEEEIHKERHRQPGYGIHWPLIDEDISIDGLLEVIHQPALEKLRA